MQTTKTAIIAAALLSTSCGGGGGSDNGPVIVMPAPGPTETPIPAPAPTPTPAATYDTAFDFSRDRSFAAITGQLTATGSLSTGTRRVYSGITGTLINPAANPTLGYVAATQDASFTLNNGAPRIYPGSQISLRQSDRIIYTAPDGFFNFAQPGPLLGGFPTALRYVLLSVQNSEVRNAAGDFDIVERRSVAGSSTVAADVPRTGSASYRILLTSSSYTALQGNGFTAQDATLTVNYASGAVQGTITVTSTDSSVATRSILLTFAGQLSTTTNRINGTVTSADGSGPFSGELYGPAGAELGLAFTLQQGSEQIVGTAVGGKR